MSISATKRHYIKGAAVSFALSVLAVVFTLVYYRYSHKVYSDYMTYMFLVPLIGGTIIYELLLLFSRFVKPSRLAFCLHNSGLTLLTCGLCATGIFEISGGDSPYAIGYYIGGFAFLASGFIAFVTAQFTKKKDA